MVDIDYKIKVGNWTNSNLYITCVNLKWITDNFSFILLFSMLNKKITLMISLLSNRS